MKEDLLVPYNRTRPGVELESRDVKADRWSRSFSLVKRDCETNNKDRVRVKIPGDVLRLSPAILWYCLGYTA